MRRLSTLGLLLAASAVLAACDSTTVLGFEAGEHGAWSAPIRTDSSVYHLRTTEHSHELVMELEYENPTGGRVYVPTCLSPTPPVLQKRVGTEWVTAYAPVVLLCLGPPVVIERGETYRYTFHVIASRRPNTLPRFEVGEIPGTYRLVWHMLGSWTPDGPEPGLGRELPLEHRVSEPFRIER